jgi:Carboxypeptidase regulatory-like domain
MSPSSFRSHRFSVFLSCLIGFLLLGATAWGQTGTTAIFGRVSDPQGAAVVGASVTITNTGTGASRKDDTDSSGNYRFPSLAPGAYTVLVEMKGFRASKTENVQLLVDTQNKHDIHLQVGATTEVVEVSATAETINTTDASLGNAFGEDRIKELPLEARNVVGLLSLQAGAVYLPVPNTDDDPRNGSISGSRADQTNVTLDGVDVNDSLTGYAYNSALRVTLDSVQEFRVTTTNYTADMGRSSSAQVSLVTKSGTNTWHGAAYWDHRNTAFSSNEFFNKLSQLRSGEENKQPKLQKHIYGASLGFAPIKNRLFFFGNFENLREASESSVQRDIPSMSMRDGVLIYECATPAQCPGGSIAGFGSSHQVPAGFFGMGPSSLAALDPLGIGPSVGASQYMNQYPVPNDPGRDGLNFVGFRFAAPVGNNLWTYISRLDYKIDGQGKHTVFARGNLQNDHTDTLAPQFPGSAPNAQLVGNNKGISVGYTAVLTNHLVNNFRYGYTRIGLGTGGQRDGNLNYLRFIDPFPYANDSYTFLRFMPTHNWVNDTTWTHGNHTLQFGTNLRLTRVERSTNSHSFHDGVANGSWVDGSGANFLPGISDSTTGCPNCPNFPAIADASVASWADSWIDILGVLSEIDASYNYDKTGTLSNVGDPVVHTYGANDYEFYVQDSWRLRPNLTLTAGLRYGYYTPPWETNGEQVCPTPGLGDWFETRRAAMLAGQPSSSIPDVSVDLCGRANGRPDYFNPSKTNFEPRVAFAYQPNFDSGILGFLTGKNKLVLRGGYGLVHDHIGLALVSRYDDFGAFGLSSQISSPFGQNNEDNPNIRWQNTTTIPSTLPSAPPGGFPQTPPTARDPVTGLSDIDNVIPQGVITSSLDNKIGSPYAHMWNFVIGRELPWNTSLEVSYVGRRGRHILTRRDMAMYEDLADPQSGMSYFQAAQMAVLAGRNLPRTAPPQDFAGFAPIPYFENLFPGFAGPLTDANTGITTNLTATQRFIRNLRRNNGDYTTTLFNADEFCSPDCSIYGPFAYFSTQYDSLAAQSTVGHSEYHAMQVMFRKKASKNLQFDFNYTLSKSNDLASQVERGSAFGNFGTTGYSGFLLNSWDPKQNYAPSDFDVRHQININYVFNLPVGKGEALGGGMPGWANAFVGGWQLAGIYRWTSGFTLNVQNCRSCWPTNWNLQGNASLVDPNDVPATGTTYNAVSRDDNGNYGYPSPFRDPEGAVDQFARTLPGQSGQRNFFRGDGFFEMDLGIGKTWKMPYKESHELKFRWEIFNLTNKAKFNTGDVTALPDSPNFGQYNTTVNPCDGAAGRCMQVSMRYSF